MKIIIETDRFFLREIVEADVDPFFAMDSDPAVHQFLGRQPLTDKAQTLAIIQYVQQQYKQNGIGRWAIEEKTTRNFMGWAGLKLICDEPMNGRINFYDIGYRLSQKYWGQGIASETASAALKYGFEVMQLKEIFAATQIENIASNRILTKLGFQWIENFDYEGDAQNFYQIEAANWQEL